MAEFTHLHLHTDYSLLDGACDVEKLVSHVADIGQKAVAITDHGNIYGAVHFFEAAKKQGIKPILGCELYICQKEDHRADPQGDEYNHLLVLAENEEGYRNLVRITSEASLHGFYRKPRISKKYLAEACAGPDGILRLPGRRALQQLMPDNYEEARRTAAQYQDIFGRGNFFLEIQDQGLELEKKIHADLFRLERELDIPLVATNDSHYLCEDDHHAHEVLLCVQTADSIHDPKRFKFDSDQFYVKSGGRDGAALLACSRRWSAARCSSPSAARSSSTRSIIRSRSLRCRPATRSTAISKRCAAKAFASGSIPPFATCRTGDCCASPSPNTRRGWSARSTASSR